MSAETYDVILEGVQPPIPDGALVMPGAELVRSAHSYLGIMQRTMLLADVQCAHHVHADERTENMSEHNFGLLLLSAERAARKGLQAGHAARLAVVNQFDTVDYSPSAYGPIIPLPTYLANLVTELNAQKTPESRLVRQTDQLWRAGRLPNYLKGLENCIEEMCLTVRVPRYTPERRENNAEHSIMDAAVAMQLIHDHYPMVDDGRACIECGGHDAIETITGDTPTMILDDAGFERKCAAEQAALPDLLKTLPPMIGSVIAEYERQETFTSQVCRMVDKTLPTGVDIIGPGEQVVREDFGVYTRAEMQTVIDNLNSRYMDMFPPAKFGVIHAVHSVMHAIQLEQMPVDAITAD